MSAKVTEITSVDPVGAFEAMIKVRDAQLVTKGKRARRPRRHWLFSNPPLVHPLPAFTQMQAIIKRFVGDGKDYYSRALDCLKALREGSIGVRRCAWCLVLGTGSHTTGCDRTTRLRASTRICWSSRRPTMTMLYVPFRLSHTVLV